MLARISRIWAAICSVAAAVCRESSLTSEATTAKPRPDSPALAASIVALRARRFVRLAMSWMTSRMRPMSSAVRPRSDMTEVDWMTVEVASPETSEARTQLRATSPNEELSSSSAAATESTEVETLRVAAETSAMFPARRRVAAATSSDCSSERRAASTISSEVRSNSPADTVSVELVFLMSTKATCSRWVSTRNAWPRRLPPVSAWPAASRSPAAADSTAFSSGWLPPPPASRASPATPAPAVSRPAAAVGQVPPRAAPTSPPIVVRPSIWAVRSLASRRRMCMTVSSAAGGHLGISEDPSAREDH